MRSKKFNNVRALAVAAMAVIGSTAALQAGTTGDAVTISLSGSTAMRNFTISTGFTALTPGTSITLNSGAGGAPVTYSAQNNGNTSVNLAANDALSFTPNPTTSAAVNTANYLALRVEWHEQGSVEGINELVDSQIDETLIVNNATSGYNPNSATAVYVNRNAFGSTAGPSNIPTPGVTSTRNNFVLGAFASATDRTSTQIQNRVQMAISDVNARQGYSLPGTSSPAKKPGQDGYGKGNPAFGAINNTDTRNLGVANSRKALNDVSVLNMSTDRIDYQTGTNYIAGPWNTAGLGNLNNVQVAITATTFSANPGTGLTKLNRTDAQFLQATGRLGNGADFNVATRDVNSGTLNVASLNVGLDPSYAVGENDSGTGAASGEDTIGAGIRFTNKSSGGSNLRPVVQNSRMAVGHLSISDYRNSSSNNGNRPLRALAYRDDADDISNGSNSSFGYSDPASGDAGFFLPSASAIVNNQYVIWQNQNYVTVKQPSAANAGLSVAAWSALTDADTGIRGDNTGNDVADVRNNITSAVAQFPSSNSTGNPADALISTSFILPQFQVRSKTEDGINTTVPNAGYQSGISGLFLGSTLANNFTVNTSAATATSAAASTVKAGGSPSTYGNISSGIPITSTTGVLDGTNGGTTTGNGGNWLFGNFNQNGVRDFSALKSAQVAQAALFTSGLGVSWGTGALANSGNGTVVSGLPAGLVATSTTTKGALIVLGDYDSNGTFDGRDLYLFARGAALATDTTTDRLTATGADDFGDKLRTGLLRKNAALDYLDINATTQQKLDARANATNDAAGVNAFNKADVNRDGLVNIEDAFIVDKFTGKSYATLSDQLDAVISTDGRFASTPATAKPISLVDVKLEDSTAGIAQGDANAFNNARGLTGSVQTYSWTGSTVKPGTLALATSPAAGSSITVPTGATFTINSGSFTAGGTTDVFTDNTVATATTGNSLTVINNAASGLVISGGTKTLRGLSGTGSSSVSSGAILNVNVAPSSSANTVALAQSALTVAGRVNIGGLTGGLNSTVSVVGTLSITGAGFLNLGTNDLILTSTSEATARGFVASWFANGARNGAGLGTDGSSLSNLTTLGVTTAAVDGTFDGQAVAAGNVLVKYTYFGDADLNGKVETADIVALIKGIRGGLTGWANGDTNYDGVVNGVDYANVIAAYQQYTLTGVSLTDSTVPVTVGTSVGGGQIPEPSALGLLLAAAPLMGRRRRA